MQLKCLMSQYSLQIVISSYLLDVTQLFCTYRDTQNWFYQPLRLLTYTNHIVKMEIVYDSMRKHVLNTYLEKHISIEYLITDSCNNLFTRNVEKKSFYLLLLFGHLCLISTFKNVYQFFKHYLWAMWRNCKQ